MRSFSRIHSLLACVALAAGACVAAVSGSAAAISYAERFYRRSLGLVVDTFFGLTQAAPKIEAQDNPNGGSAISFAQARSFMQRLMQRSVQRSGFGSMQSLHLAM